MKEEGLSIEEIEYLKNMTIADLGNRLDNDIIHMALVDGEMSVYDYIKMITY